MFIRTMIELSTRQLLILEELRQAGRVEVSALARKYDVAEMTIRRDLAGLERVGSVRRFHGGAHLGPGRAMELPYALRVTERLAEKRRIAAAAIEEFSEGQAVYLDVGSTALEIAKRLAEQEDGVGLTVITASLRVLGALADTPRVRLISLGGEVRPEEQSLIGPLAEAVLDRLWIDVCVLGVAGVEHRAGLTEYNLADAEVKRAVIERSERVVVSADHSKIGRTSFALVARADTADLVITDSGADPTELDRLRDMGVACDVV
jgi:DeoR/GlpR family transcriptional regulator of sugar metabolism